MKALKNTFESDLSYFSIAFKSIEKSSSLVQDVLLTILSYSYEGWDNLYFSQKFVWVSVKNFLRGRS